jgi:hypothetical protein
MLTESKPKNRVVLPLFAFLLVLDVEEVGPGGIAPAKF